MPALQIKDCPENVYERLRMCAAEQNRSISQQTLTILEEYLGFREKLIASEPFCFGESDDVPAPGKLIEKRRRIFERIDSRSPISISKELPDAAELLREIREEEAR